MELNCGYGSKTNRLPKLYNLLWWRPNASLKKKKKKIIPLDLPNLMLLRARLISMWAAEFSKGNRARAQSAAAAADPESALRIMKYTLNASLLLLLHGREKNPVFWTSIKQHAGVCNLPNGPRRSDLSNNGEPWRTRRSHKITAFSPVGWSLRTQFAGLSFTSFHLLSFFFVLFRTLLWKAVKPKEKEKVIVCRIFSAICAKHTKCISIYLQFYVGMQQYGNCTVLQYFFSK